MSSDFLPRGTKCNKCGKDQPPIYVRAKVYWCKACWLEHNGVSQGG